MNTYKTKDGRDVVIPGVGRTVNGIITTAQTLESPNLELVDTTETNPSSAHVAGVAPQAAQPTVTPSESDEASDNKETQN